MVRLKVAWRLGAGIKSKQEVENRFWNKQTNILTKKQTQIDRGTCRETWKGNLQGNLEWTSPTCSTQPLQPVTHSPNLSNQSPIHPTSPSSPPLIQPLHPVTHSPNLSNQSPTHPITPTSPPLTQHFQITFSHNNFTHAGLYYHALCNFLRHRTESCLILS